MPANTQNQTQATPQNSPPSRSEKVLFSWSAPERPFKRRTREFWVSVSAIAAIVSLILFLIEGPVSVILVISIIFLFYMLSTVEPKVIKYEITNYSINIAESKNDISMFIRYWFDKRFDVDILVLETTTIPGRLELVINPSDKKAIKKALDKFFEEGEAVQDNIDAAAGWLSGKIPGNT